MLNREQIAPFLKEYCKDNSINYDVAYKQIKLASKDYVCLFVNPPDITKADGLKNDRDVLMLPTLFIRKNDKRFYAEETQYTEKYLKGARA